MFYQRFILSFLLCRVDYCNTAITSEWNNMTYHGWLTCLTIFIHPLSSTTVAWISLSNTVNTLILYLCLGFKR